MLDEDRWKLKENGDLQAAIDTDVVFGKGSSILYANLYGFCVCSGESSRLLDCHNYSE